MARHRFLYRLQPILRLDRLIRMNTGRSQVYSSIRLNVRSKCSHINFSPALLVSLPLSLWCLERPGRPAEPDPYQARHSVLH